MDKTQPRILIFTVSSWNSKVGANTWASILKNYDSVNLANICIRNEIPDSKVCSRYFTISESKIIRSVLNRRIRTGQEINVEEKNEELEKDLKEHNSRYLKMSQKRKIYKLLGREIIWMLGRWKTKELNDFLEDFKPNIILHSMEGYIHLNRIIEYSIQKTGAKAIGYIWDDNFTYKQSPKMGYKFYRFFQRRSLKSLAKKSQAFFAITEKTKREADAFFGIDCQVLSKPLNAVPVVEKYDKKTLPLRFLYTGNLLIGRDKTLEKIIEVLKVVNKKEKKILIDVYTKTQLNKDSVEKAKEVGCIIHKPIQQSEVIKLQKETDVLLFLEDIGKENLAARLSFSTKITDYLSSGKCIFAVGNRDLAPMEYFSVNRAALVSYNEEDIKKNFEKVLQDTEILRVYAKNAAECGIKNHNVERIFSTFNNTLMRVYKGAE